MGVVAIGALAYGCAAFTRPDTESREDVLARLLPSAVQIVLENPEGRRFRTGSGVIIAARPSGDGSTSAAACFVLTSGHTVTGAAGQKAIYLVVVAHRETADVDVALLRAESRDCVPARPAGAPKLGEPVWVLAFPWGRSMVLAGGIVSQVHADDVSRFMVDASVSYGSSGGGVYDAGSGGLIGLVEGYRTARVTSQGSESPWYIDVPMPGHTLVTPLADIKRFLADTGHGDLIEGAPSTSTRAAR